LYFTRQVWGPLIVLVGALVAAGAVLTAAFATGGGGASVRGLLFGLPVGLVLGGVGAFAAYRRKRAELARASRRPDGS
ncbi:hypothetical protein AB0J52_08690, partial [Spirillospora sp. NPDC049652]